MKNLKMLDLNGYAKPISKKMWEKLCSPKAREANKKWKLSEGALSFPLPKPKGIK